MDKGGKHKRNEKAIAIVARNIRKYRKTQNLTINELASLIEVDYSQISRMERGVINPSISVIFSIAEVLKIKPSQLLEE